MENKNRGQSYRSSDYRQDRNDSYNKRSEGYNQGSGDNRRNYNERSWDDDNSRSRGSEYGNSGNTFGNNDRNWRNENLNPWDDNNDRSWRGSSNNNWRDNSWGDNDSRGSSGYGGNYGNRGGETDFLSRSYGRTENDRGSNYNRNRGDRDWWDKTTDEVQSWFGDEEAERRRKMDRVNEGKHKGRGPKGYKRSDERIKDDVNDRLSDDHYVDATDIEVSVTDGEVVLSGSVDSKQAKRRAEDIAEGISGVANVQNHLRVTRSNDNDSFRTGNAGLGTTTSGLR